MDDCYTSWEQEEAIPAAVLREFEAQISVNVNETCCDNIGHTLHTLGITTKEKLQPETLKKPKTDRIVLEEDNGAFKPDPKDTDGLSCNTEKDRKTRLHEHSAGILAGIWPCGTVTMVDELFSSESKAQVYGCLHGFVHTNMTTTESIGICKLTCIRI